MEEDVTDDESREYEVILVTEDDSSVLASCSELGLEAQGASEDEALDALAQLIAEHLSSESLLTA